MHSSINYGILGLGKIAHKFVRDLLLSHSSNLYAVASRSQEKAEQFKEEFGVQKAYGSYEALLQDPNVDVVYIATPHHLHYPLILQCLEHGKNVLCEKPICINAQQVEAIIQKQKETHLFVMEAMWTKFIPAYQELKRQIQHASLMIESIQADFAYKAVKDPEWRLYNPNLAGGALLDIGIYPIFLALDLMGVPDEIVARGFVKDGVDVRCSSMFVYSEGRTAQLYSDFESESKMEGVIRTSRGIFIMPERWHEINEFYFKLKNDLKVFKVQRIGFGYYHEIEHVNLCLRERKVQSPIHTLNDSLALIKLLDEIRRQIGLKYPDPIEKC